MNKTKRIVGKLGIVLCTALLSQASQGQPSVSIGVEIRTESDFYEPLTPLGEWVVIGSYGRCWRPARVEADWRPYSDGYWQRTEGGWFWASDEPWGWATYHYGRWNFADEYGWYWVPQTVWAPAWVSWHSGGGYVGWAPLYPVGVTVISPRAYVFVEERHFMEPVRRSTVVVNNTTIINQTVIKEAPTTVVVEKAIGHKVEAVPVRELRQKSEAAVVGKTRTSAVPVEKAVQPPVRNEPQPAGNKVASPREAPKIEKPAPTTHEPVAPVEKNGKGPGEKNGKGPGDTIKPAPTAATSRPAAPNDVKAAAAKPEGRPMARPVAVKQPAGQNPGNQSVKQEKPAQAPADQKPVANGKDGGTKDDKNREIKPKE